VLDRAWVEEIKAKLPELPEERRDRFVAEYGLPLYDAKLLTASRDMADYFEECLKASQLSPKEMSNWLLGEVSRIINESVIDVTEFSKKVSPERLAKLAALSAEEKISTATAKSVLAQMYQSGKSADDIIKAQGLSQISDAGAIEAEISRVIKENAPAVADYKAGKKQSLKFLVGQVMRATKGRANPAVVNELMEKKLEEG
jgi:aspartyl-tRNA(Asn)/glutamyl-tRNA(Gln) amidotransferase subunit B